MACQVGPAFRLSGNVLLFVGVKSGDLGTRFGRFFDWTHIVRLLQFLASEEPKKLMARIVI